ncbi:MAG: oligoribonuclease [Actinobacteria bacterium]|nr:oligoribonuclease [Actinomycetota bacterium]
MDLEMTGLDPTRDYIVEIATLITDDGLKVLGEGPDLVISVPTQVLDAMEEPVKSMHERSGLTESIKNSNITLEVAGKETLEFIKTYVPKPRSVPLCGNSIGTDRRFLAAYLPEIEQWLHYRSIDVSTLKELCKRWNPSVFALAPEKSSHHRAMDDIRESIAELEYYRRYMLR